MNWISAVTSTGAATDANEGDVKSSEKEMSNTPINIQFFLIFVFISDLPYLSFVFFEDEKAGALEVGFQLLASRLFPFRTRGFLSCPIPQSNE
jgi:hypothetical protein